MDGSQLDPSIHSWNWVFTKLTERSITRPDPQIEIQKIQNMSDLDEDDDDGYLAHNCPHTYSQNFHCFLKIHFELGLEPIFCCLFSVEGFVHSILAYMHRNFPFPETGTYFMLTFHYG